MQRYRVNYFLLTVLFVGSLIFSVSAYFLWAWQIDRKAGLFKDRASAALEEGEPYEAFEYLLKYVQLRPDEHDARVELADVAQKVFEIEGADREMVSYAYAALEETVRLTGDPRARRKLAEIQLSFRPQDALGHVEQLLDSDPDDPELNVLRLTALYATKDHRRGNTLAMRLIGYDKKTDEFGISKATAKDKPVIYDMLARRLYDKEEDAELARRVIDQLVEVNPDLPEAHLRRSTYLYTTDEKEEAAVSLEKAFELGPQDIDVLMRKGTVAAEDERPEEALQFYRQVLEIDPENPVVYGSIAYTELGLQNVDEAIAVLDQGIKRFEVKRSPGLVILKIDILLQKKNYKEVEKAIELLDDLVLEDVNKRTLIPLIDLQRARVKWKQSKWAEAAKEFKRIRPQLIDNIQAKVLCGYLLGTCYERLGNPDLARKYYDLVLIDNPTHNQSILGKQRVMKTMGIAGRVSPGMDFDKMISEMTALPESEQDWSRIDEFIDDYVEERGLKEARTKLFRAQVLIARKMYPEAKKLIAEAHVLDPDDFAIGMVTVILVAEMPDQGLEQAIRILDRLEEKMGSDLRTRSMRADLLLKLGGEELASELNALSDGVELWSDTGRSQLYSVLANKFLQLGMPNIAVDYLNRSAELVPDNLPIRMQLFELAHQQRDDTAMRKAQEEILRVIGSKTDASYIVTEVRRQIMANANKIISHEELKKARGLLDDALRQRPEWSELHITYAKLLLTLGEDTDLALQHLDDASKFGRANPRVVALQVNLLAKRGRIVKAREKMLLIPERLRPILLGRLEAELYLRSNEVSEAFDSAEKVAVAHPDDPSTQVWFARIARRDEKLDEAITALRRATELVPSSLDNWTQLISLYAQQKKYEELVSVFREAHLSLDAEFLPTITAKAFELQGLWQNAEDIYLSDYSNDPDDLTGAQSLAEFYLRWVHKDRANIERAASYINRILRAANELKVSEDNPHVRWARQQAAKLLADSKDYQRLLKAQRMLMQSAVDGKLSSQDQGLLAQILAARNDPKSQQESIRMLTAMKKDGKLGKSGFLLLSKLLNNANNWERSKEVLLDAIPKFRKDPQVWIAYIEKQIEHGEYSAVKNSLSRLKEVSTQRFHHLKLSALLASKQGDQERVRRLLTQMLPQNLKKGLSENELQVILAVARLAAVYEDYKLAEELFSLHFKRVPETIFDLTKFHATYGDVNKAIDLMSRQFEGQTDVILQLAVAMLRKRRDEVGAQLDQVVNQMLSRALREDRDSIQRQLLKAEALEIQARYEESIATYDKILERDDVPATVRAVAMNNLGFQLALNNERLDEAHQLVDEAMKTFGPVSDMLDTRAMVCLARNEYDLAVEDMELALSISKDPVKYFHLAKVHMGAGNGPAALRAWDQALANGFKKEALMSVEQENFDEIKAQIENLRSQNDRL